MTLHFGRKFELGDCMRLSRIYIKALKLWDLSCDHNKIVSSRNAAICSDL